LQKGENKLGLNINDLIRDIFPNLGKSNFKEIDLSGKIAKLDKESIQQRIQRKELSEKYVEWFNEFGDNSFTLKRYPKYKDFYEFEGAEPWVFHMRDLIIEGWEKEDYDEYWKDVL
jgi:aspartyl/asparaginyl-tRNA synthetase